MAQDELALPPLPPVAFNANWSFVVNLGLPRTGTTSFSLAAAMLGMRVRHVWCRRPWRWADTCVNNRTKHLPSQKEVDRGTVADIRGVYEALADDPFFMVKREEYLSYAASHGGKVTFICTARPKEDWVKSIMYHGTAGGTEMHLMMERLFNEHVRFPYNETVGRFHDKWSHDPHAPAVLGRYYDYHMANQCNVAAERLWLNDELSFSQFCPHVPDRFRQRCEVLAAAKMCWPRLNSKASSSSSSSVLDAASSCRPWPEDHCHRDSRTMQVALPRERTNGGSVEGRIQGDRSLHRVVCGVGSEGRNYSFA